MSRHARTTLLRGPRPPSASLDTNTQPAAQLWTLHNPSIRPGCSPVSTDSLTVSWPAGATGWVLQECPDLSLGAWSNATRTVSTVGDQKQVIITPLTGCGFFRLVHP